MKVKLLSNRLFYIPRWKVFVSNALLGVALLLIAYYLRFLPSDFVQAITTITSPVASLVILLISVSLTLAVVWVGITRYFIGARQALGPSIGMTMIAVLIYASLWGALQIGQERQTFVLLSMRQWNFDATINSFAAGALLACLSSLALTRIKFFKDEDAFDFGPFQKDFALWRSLVAKRRSGSKFLPSDHKTLISTTRSMIDSLSATPGYVQPIAEECLDTVREMLTSILNWYEKKTRFSPEEFSAFPIEIVALISRVEKIAK